MSNTSSNDATSMEARVTDAGGSIAERVQSVTAATAAAAGHAQKIVEDAATATVAAANQAKKVLGDAAQQAWSQAGGVAEDVVDAGRRATKSVSQQIQERPLMVALVGFALGYVASLWIHKEGGRPAIVADDGAHAKPLRQRR
jgi:D-alanyl-D-alanine carboxypeptidase